MASFKLRLKYDLDIASCAEIAQRLKDFSIPFANIIGEWARNNARKFAASKASELSGADGGSLTPEQWQPVTLKYYGQKHGPVSRGSRTLFADWLMVRTGNLMTALTGVGGFGRDIDQHRAAFGTPLDDEARMAAYGNRKKRKTIFLSETDRLMIRRELQNYLSFGENYKEFLFARAGRLAAMKNEMAELDMNFAEAVANG